MANSTIRTALTSKRAHGAVLGNAAVSIASMVLAVACARTMTATEFGTLALALVVYGFATGITRAAFTDTALAIPSDRSVFGRSIRRSALLALVLALGIATWGLIGGNPYLIVVAGTLHGMVLLDFVRTYESAVGRIGIGLGISVSWSVIVVAIGLVSFVVPIEATWLLLTWAVAGAVSGYIAVITVRAPLMPGWERQPAETTAAVLFTGDYLVGSGGGALTTTLVGALVDNLIVGALRGAGTLLGPVNLVASTARSLTIPLIARSGGDAVRVARIITLMLVTVAVPLLVAVQFIPDDWGRWLLGETWAAVSLILVPIAVESFFVLIGGVPAAGHRAMLAGGRTLVLRLSVGIPRPAIVLVCAMVGGALGVAWAMAGIAIVNALVWWTSYRQLGRRLKVDGMTGGIPG